MRSCTIPSFLQPSESFDSPSKPVPANGAPLSVLIRAGTPYSRIAASQIARTWLRSIRETIWQRIKKRLCASGAGGGTGRFKTRKSTIARSIRRTTSRGPLIHLGVISSGRCEKIDLETWSNFGLEKNRARMPYKRPLDLQHTFRFRRNLREINFFTSSRPASSRPASSRPASSRRSRISCRASPVCPCCFPKGSAT